MTAAEVGALAPRDAIALVRATDHSGAEAVLVPDTALHTIASLAALQEAADKPVLTANQVSAWQGMRLAGAAAPAPPELGHLFSAAPTAA
jgi:maleate cis-trans isomerase